MNMVLHYDVRNGPIMKAAKMALQTGNVNYVLIWVPEESENQLKNLLEKTFCKRRDRKDVQDVALDGYFKTVSRLHRSGERVLYTCIKPDDLNESQIVPKVERAIEIGDVEEIIGAIPPTREGYLRQRLRNVIDKKNYDVNNVAAGRAYVSAFIDFIVYVHNLTTSIPGEKSHAEH
ncbi:MAG: DUF6448 family protein [Methanomicrobiales archaeon]|nr:DUF6448 family protein [Methanomicrobiales archaeon]